MVLVSLSDVAWGSKGKDARLLAQFCRLFSRMEAGDLGMVRFMAQKMARRKAFDDSALLSGMVDDCLGYTGNGPRTILSGIVTLK